jgi:hypothetical protein
MGDNGRAETGSIHAGAAMTPWVTPIFERGRSKWERPFPLRRTSMSAAEDELHVSPQRSKPARRIPEGWDELHVGRGSAAESEIINALLGGFIKL